MTGSPLLWRASDPASRGPARDAAWASVFGAGLAISAIMIARSQVAGDALSLLSRGWLFAAAGVWVPFGNPAATSAGGFVPGSLTALLVGLPLKLWMDHRSPALLILLLHVAGYLVLDRIVARELGRPARMLFAIVYWLNPWRVYQSGWLDNSNYVFFAGAIHLWACLRQRSKPSWLHSAVLVTVVGLTGQIHLDAVVLVFAAVLLWWRGYWRPHWGGIALGTALTALSLVPYALAAAGRPELLPGGGGSEPLGSGLLRVWPVLKGVSYWLRYASLAASEGMNVYDFTPAAGAAADRLLAPLYFALGRFVALLTIVPPLVANLWMLRRQRRRRRAGGARGTRDWLCGYASWTLVACLIANALSPTVVMWWENLIVLHAAVLPLLLWADALRRTRRGARLRYAAAGWALASVVLLLGMAFGAEQYRNGGRDAWTWVLPRNDRVVRDLRLTDYGVSIDPRTGHWPLNNELLYEEYLRPYELPGPAGPGQSP